ncbi:MAG: S1 RNA-binding domain-containing protein, partial [Planctomycetota bacterium]
MTSSESSEPRSDETLPPTSADTEATQSDGDNAHRGAESSAVVSQTSADEHTSAEVGSADREAATGREPAADEQPSASIAGSKPSGGGPLSLERIRQLRKSQQRAAGQQSAPAKKKPKSSSQPPRGPREGAPGESEPAAAKAPPTEAQSTGATSPTGDQATVVETGIIKTPPRPARAPKVEVPSRRKPLPRELEDEIDSAIQGADLDTLLIGDDLLQIAGSLEEGQRVRGQVVKVDDEFAFVALGGPHEGMVSLLQFENPPEVGAQIDVIIRGYLASDGMYELSIPGSAVDLTAWSDLQEGTVVEATVTAANSGGLECTVGNIRGFIPLSQISEYRVENPADFVGQKLLCVVTEANPRRGNLVLSHRAVLERERQAKREERLALLEVGQAVDGVVRKILDFGAFVDIGGVDGLLHISQLAWERVQHPSEILEEGQKIKVRVEKIDPQTGKISLSYRSLQEHPWEGIEQRFPAGSIHRGTVTRIAEFGAFVRLATGVEGLVHI